MNSKHYVKEEVIAEKSKLYKFIISEAQETNNELRDPSILCPLSAFRRLYVSHGFCSKYAELYSSFEKVILFQLSCSVL